MLIRFTVENFLSFKERVEFSMIPAKKQQLNDHIIKDEDINVLKTAVIYGANAAGKSNLIKAMSFAKQLIVKGTAPNKFIPIKPFKLDKTSLNKPSRFEFEFKHGGKNYAYGFVLNNKWILEEWLYEINQVDEQAIFERQTLSEEQIIITPGNKLEFLNEEQKGIFKYTGNISTRANQLFLTEVSKINTKKIKIPALLDAYQWFNQVLTIIFPDNLSFEINSEHIIHNNLLNLLQVFDTGILGIKTIEVDFENEVKDLTQENKDKIILNLEENESRLIHANNNRQYVIFRKDNQIKAFKLMTEHSTQDGLKALFEISEESEGTQRIIDLIPTFIILLESEKVIVIDELERSLHPRLTTTLLELFLTYSKKVKSQLIFSTHESELLNSDNLRSDVVGL
ncbi:AAA family ATPase [Candidatus Marithrix sp. Canyon 246]|uniref:AAA family ATPase n=1 Tax=Candidatus Marithrix sp. Canyon 246 TaxID=1827136 RepID=UPI0009F735A6|nr:ATP-binding protein [Candidatus Marithrix sp. Canyon 246]